MPRKVTRKILVGRGRARSVPMVHQGYSIPARACRSNPRTAANPSHSMCHKFNSQLSALSSPSASCRNIICMKHCKHGMLDSVYLETRKVYAMYSPPNGRGLPSKRAFIPRSMSFARSCSKMRWKFSYRSPYKSCPVILDTGHGQRQMDRRLLTSLADKPRRPTAQNNTPHFSGITATCSTN